MITLRVPNMEPAVANASDMCIVDGITLILAKLNSLTLDYYVMDRSSVSDSESDKARCHCTM